MAFRDNLFLLGFLSIVFFDRRMFPRSIIPSLVATICCAYVTNALYYRYFVRFEGCMETLQNLRDSSVFLPHEIRHFNYLETRLMVFLTFSMADELMFLESFGAT